jgi:hypothetical protein
LAPGRLGSRRCTGPLQREAGFEPLELDAGAGAGSQQPVGGLPQPGSALLRVLCERGVKGGKKSGNIALDPGAQLAVDVGCAALLEGRAVGAIAAKGMRISRTGRRLDKPRRRNANPTMIEPIRAVLRRWCGTQINAIAGIVIWIRLIYRRRLALDRMRIGWLRGTTCRGPVT